MDLIQHLRERYLQSLPEDAQASAAEQIAGFMSFCQKYLTENPPRQIYYPPSGLGVVLADHTSVSLAPESAAGTSPGGMQPAGAIPVTGQETLRDMAKAQKPDFKQISGSEDLTRGGGPVDYKAQSR